MHLKDRDTQKEKETGLGITGSFPELSKWLEMGQSEASSSIWVTNMGFRKPSQSGQLPFFPQHRNIKLDQPGQKLGPKWDTSTQS